MSASKYKARSSLRWISPTALKPWLLAAACAGVFAAPAMATTIVLDGSIQDYRAADGSNNYNEASVVWGTGYATVGYETGASNDPYFKQFNGRFAATIEFDIGSIPSDAKITNAAFSFGAFFVNDSIDTMRTYVASSHAVDPARARAGTFVTAFDVMDIYTQFNFRPQIDVTPFLQADLAGLDSNPIVGFSFEQVVDRCPSTRNNDCVSTIGTLDDDRLPRLTISYDVATPPPPPASPAPEPASWALMICGFGVLGGRLRRGARTKTGLAGDWSGDAMRAKTAGGSVLSNWGAGRA